MLRSKLALAALLATSLSSQAQDKIFLRDGSTIEGSVKQIGAYSVTYRRDDAPQGPDYVLNSKEVSRIVYEDGREENSEVLRVTKRHRADGTYGKNIISFAPIQMTNLSPVGIGIQYERFLDQKGMFSLYLPLAISFYEEYSNYYYGYNRQKDRAYTYLYPGLKIYPGGSSRKVSYSIGASLALGFGRKTVNYDYYYYPYYSSYMYPSYPYATGEEDVFQAGFLVNNGLNIQATKAFYLGIEVGIGVMYYTNSSNSYDYSDEPMVQGQFKMGYRF